MAESIGTRDALQAVADDFDCRMLEENVVTMTDEEYAQQLSLQEALVSSISLSDTCKPHGESSSSSLKIQDTCKDTENNSGSSNEKNTKSSADVDAGAGDASESSFCDICMMCMEAKPTTKIQENISQITCLKFNCEESLEPYLCRDIIPGQVFDSWENALCESSILASQKINCPFKDCSAMLLNDDELGVIRETECPNCSRLFCAKCKVPWHSDMNCSQYQEIMEGVVIEDTCI
ncbi:hypothetical protein MKW94_000319 [Papaver nudicaule]|uniref:IBR domain-containing protein n=1 Tax=Papaver nudicaule TaxID=74823 RepID=A0AA41VYZ2_PAPNU|nr:hypothetical protein [Papaver nudicaule]